ncbi:VOC family protein [Haloechinothrix halophila]|uniref:VOC family protein n=1 Tax=Haloechinothrix halophila TaxID=1069073 RepID=UPI0003FDE99D|nr:VOC family protein [Haloechinothrix halophila]
MTSHTTTIRPAPGTPCWIELATLDERAAQAFYAGLFGWRYHTKSDPATGTYTIASMGGVPVAGLYRVLPNQPPSWLPHLAVANVRSAVGWATNLGGTVLLNPVDIPGRGTIAHVQDPSGAVFVLWETPDDWTFGSEAPGMFSAADLNTWDGDAADGFYPTLFGLTSRQIGYAPGIDYVEWRLDEPILYRNIMGGEHHRTTPPHWLIYVTADPRVGTDAITARVESLGGAVILAPFDTGFGRAAVLADPSGARFAITDHSRPDPDWRAEVEDPYDD